MYIDQLQSQASSPMRTMTGGSALAPSTELGKEDFLRLLTTQLANQDPLSPSDPTQFISQLAELTSLEQLTNVNQGLDVLAVSQTAGTSAQMVSFVGKEVSYVSDQLLLDEPGEGSTLHFDLGGEAKDVKVHVKNSAGVVVRTLELGSLGEGPQEAWFDGTDDPGNPLPEGTYTFEVEATDVAGELVEVDTRSTGFVASISFAKGYPELLMEDGSTVTLGQVIEVTSSTETEAGEEAGSDDASPSDAPSEPLPAEPGTDSQENQA